MISTREFYSSYIRNDTFESCSKRTTTRQDAAADSSSHYILYRRLRESVELCCHPTLPCSNSPGYPISIRKCPFNDLQMYHMCPLNAVHLPPLSPYTYSRDLIAMGPFDCEHIPCDCKGQLRKNIACLQASGKGVPVKKLRYYLAIIALAATLSGPALQGLGAGSMANAASSRHVSSSFVTGKSTRSLAFGRYPPCPSGGSIDC